jgi:hypothetical protein
MIINNLCVREYLHDFSRDNDGGGMMMMMMTMLKPIKMLPAESW